MITSSQQYRVTEQKLKKFQQALEQIPGRSGWDPFLAVRRNAVLAQIRELQGELDEFDELRSGEAREFVVATLHDLPVALIKARITRGISQSDLAEMIGVKAQQLQRWEQERYRTVVIQRLASIAQALGVRISDRVMLDEVAPVTVAEVRRSMVRMGLPRDVFDRRLKPRPSAAADEPHLIDELDARLGVLFRMGAREAAAGTELTRSQMRFKLPKSAAQERTRAYATYVEGLAEILLGLMSEESRPVSERWREAREQLFPSGKIDFRAAVDACFRRNIFILPVRDPVAFHGACFRKGGRTILILKQPSKEASRWLIDLIHELYHDAVAPPGDFGLIEEDETSEARRASVEERRATRFATEIVTNGRTEVLTREVVDRAGGFGPRLKSATVEVAASSGVPVGLLANLVAMRLDEGNGFKWWNVAGALQEDAEDPFDIVRRTLFEHLDLSTIPRVEKDILLQALEDIGGN